MSIIKCAILCVPVYDEDAVDRVRRTLAALTPGAVVLADRHVASRRYQVEETLRRCCDEEELDLVLTVGGTLPAPGPGAGEIVPEATLAVVERLTPGLPEAMRAYAQDETPLALLDRSVAGIRGRTLIVNLPAGAAAATLFLEAIAEVLAPIVAHLQEDPGAPRLADAIPDSAGEPATKRPQPASTATSDALVPDAGDTRHKLDPEEFAEYLRRRTSGA